MYAVIFTDRAGEVKCEWESKDYGYLRDKIRAHDMIIPSDWEYEIINTDHEYLDEWIVIEEYAKRKKKECAAR
jgi:hypothetical protein